jgi:hypothetical protein
MQALSADQLESANKIITKMKTAMDAAKDEGTKQAVFLDNYLELTNVLTEDQLAQFLAIVSKTKRNAATQPSSQPSSQTAPTTRP